VRTPIAVVLRVVLSLGVVLLATDVRADPFIVQPDGSVLLNSTLTTTGVFTCKLSQCSGTGTNTVTFENATGRASITFTGVDTAIEVTNRATLVTLGQFEATSTPGFTFPSRTNRNNPVVHFALFATQGDPVDATKRNGWNFGPGGRIQLPILTGFSDFQFDLPDFDSAFGYSAINYHVRRFSLPSSGTVNLQAHQGVIPEPGSLILLASGLAGAAIARRRARRSKLRTRAR
jgi:hypothetical protein